MCPHAASYAAVRHGSGLLVCGCSRLVIADSWASRCTVLLRMQVMAWLRELAGMPASRSGPETALQTKCKVLLKGVHRLGVLSKH